MGYNFLQVLSLSHVEPASCLPQVLVLQPVHLQNRVFVGIFYFRDSSDSDKIFFMGGVHVSVIKSTPYLRLPLCHGSTTVLPW